MDKTKTSLITILAILMFGIPIILGNSYKHILIIYSTSADAVQTNEINRGMDLYLGNNADFARTILFDHYYLDMENPARQKCEIYLTESKKVQDILENNKPDLVILSGDIAQRLIGIRLAKPQSSDKRYLKNNLTWLAKQGKCADNGDLRSKLGDALNPITFNPQKIISLKGFVQSVYTPKIVFTGVTASDVKEYGYYPSENLTGIYQRLYTPAIKEAVEDLYTGIQDETTGKPASLIVMGDSTSIASPDIQQLKAELSKKNVFNVSLNWGGIKEASTWQKWQETVRSANQNKAMIFVAGYGNIPDQPPFSVLRWTENCAQYPVLGGAESFIDDGGMLTVTISNQEQGASALELSRQLLTGSATENIPFLYPNQFTIGVNQYLLEKRQITLPAMYESFSRLNDTFQNDNYQYINPGGCDN